jgi:D-3-phosphoglycerate dehydrogenase
MPRVLIPDNLSAAGVESVKRAGLEVDYRPGLKGNDLIEALKGADGVIIRSGVTLTADILKGQSRLKAIVRAGVGVDNIDTQAATREGIVVMNTPAGNTISTAEHTMALLLGLARNVGPADASMHAGKWDRKSFTGTQLAGKTLGVVGLGRIGLAVAKRALSFEMRVLGYDPFFTKEKAAEHGIEFHPEVDTLLPQCDFITVHTPLTDETRGLIGKERMAKLKKGVRIVNCARGGIIDENALADALDAGQVAGAALDVFEKEPPAAENRVSKHPKILATPHLGASTDEAQEMVALEAAEIISGFLQRGEIRHAVNMAAISATEMNEMKAYLDLSYRLGLLLAQQVRGQTIVSAEVVYRGDATSKKTKLMTNAFATGLLEQAMADSVNIVNAEFMARERGLQITSSSSSEPSDFATLIRAAVKTSEGEISAAGTIFGKEFLRLVKLGNFTLDAYLDGTMLVYKHRDVPGLIGYIGTVCGNHKVNIAHMALGREKAEPGGQAIAVLNVDSEPSAAAIEEIRKHAEVTGVDLIKLPKAGAALPWASAS